MAPLLEVRHMTVQFARRKGGRSGAGNNRGKELAAVNDLSFSLDAGETLGIVGESGSGKSTVERAVTRLIQVTSGEIFLNGEEITRAEGRRKRQIYQQIQMVFQSPVSSFDPRRTLGDGIGESLRNQGMPRQRVREEVERLLEQCGLPAEYGARYPHQVSGGECQRAAVARAIACRPALLICDEATSALDMLVQKQIMELLGRMKTEYRLSCMFISHDLALVQGFCDRILVMQEGRAVEEGPAEEVILRPRTAYTRRLIEAV